MIDFNFTANKFEVQLIFLFESQLVLKWLVLLVLLRFDVFQCDSFVLVFMFKMQVKVLLFNNSLFLTV